MVFRYVFQTNGQGTTSSIALYRMTVMSFARGLVIFNLHGVLHRLSAIDVAVEEDLVYFVY